MKASNGSGSGTSAREVLLGGLNLVQQTLLGNLQRLEDYIERQLDDDVELTEYPIITGGIGSQLTTKGRRPPLNFDDEDSQVDDDGDADDEDSALAMSFDRKGASSSSGGGGDRQSNSASGGGQDDSVPQSPPSLHPSSQQNDQEESKMMMKQQQEQQQQQKEQEDDEQSNQMMVRDVEREGEDEEVFDPINNIEVCFDNLQTKITKYRGLLRSCSRGLVLGNLVVFLAFFVLHSLPVMSQTHSLFFTLIYSATVFISAIHLIFCFEKARRTDAGTPEKISIHSQGALHDPTTRFTLEDMRGFSPAFRNLLGYRNKGYVSLMHVQAQFGQQQSNAYESSTDEDSHVMMGGLQCCTDCEHHPIKPLRSLHCQVCDQDTILSDGHSYLVDNCIGINNRRYYLMLWSTMTLLMLMAIYPLQLLDQESAVLTAAENPHSLSRGLRVLAATQLAFAAFGFVLSFIYTQFVWYAALTGLYQVDTYNGLLIRENPRRKLQRAANMTSREQVLILFGTTDVLEILDTWQYESRPLPLKGLEWTFLQSEGGITTSDEEEEEFERLL